MLTNNPTSFDATATPARLLFSIDDDEHGVGMLLCSKFKKPQFMTDKLVIVAKEGHRARDLAIVLLDLGYSAATLLNL